MKQLGLFEDDAVEPQQESQIAVEVTTEQLLAMRDQLLETIEVNSDLPEIMYGVSGGICTQNPRRNFICKGYSYRVAEPDTQELAGMIFGMLFNLALGGERYYRLHATPDPNLIRQARELTTAYYRSHPVQGD
jgi:hypothetical protein